MSDERPQNRRELESLIIRKIWADPQYKSDFQENPKKMLEAELREIYPDINLPDELTVNLIEEDSNSISIVVPTPPGQVELDHYSEEELIALSRGEGLINLNANVNINVNANANVNVNVNVNVNTGTEAR